VAGWLFAEIDFSRSVTDVTICRLREYQSCKSSIERVDLMCTTRDLSHTSRAASPNKPPSLRARRAWQSPDAGLRLHSALLQPDRDCRVAALLAKTLVFFGTSLRGEPEQTTVIASPNKPPSLRARRARQSPDVIARPKELSRARHRLPGLMCWKTPLPGEFLSDDHR